MKFWRSKPSASLIGTAQPPQDTAQHGINDSWLRRNLTLVSIALLHRWRPSRSSVLMLTASTCVKYGGCRHLSEAEAMVYVARHTSVPVPKVYCAFRRKGVTYIVMERIKGVSIGRVWDSSSEEQRKSLLSQLRGFIAELRSVPPPQPGRIGDVNYSMLYDDRIEGKGFGPFDDSREFHRFLRNGVAGSVKDPDLNRLIHDHERQDYKTCFTHGDLSSFNILVRDGRVVGIIDWEMAGWYPEYWEYTSAWHVNPYDEWWRPEVNKFLDVYPAELEMETLRRKLFPMF
ncbi:hypothetical protein VTO42DRAFT_7221 [Malbranchea cinnamomea]